MFAGVGPILIDHIYSIDKFPEKGGHVIVKKSMKMLGGAATNVLYGLSKFGIDCTLYSTIGTGEDAEFYTEYMSRVGIELKLKKTHSDTGRVDVFVDSNGERTFFVHPNAAGILDIELNYEDLKKIKYIYLDPFPAKNSLKVHIDIARKFKNSVARNSELNKEKENKKNIVILNCGHLYSEMVFEELSKLLKYVDILFLSEFELRKMGKKDEDFLNIVETLIVTMSEKGSRAITKSDYGENGLGKWKKGLEREFHAPAFTVKAVDTTGAGDAFACGFIFAYHMGAPLDLCLKTGNYVASHNIQYYGGKNFPERDDVQKFIERELERCRQSY